MPIKIAAVIAGLIALAIPLQQKPSGLGKKAEFALEGGGSFDYINVDPEAGRLYIAHSPKIDVLDAKKGTKLGEVSGVDGAHGAVAVGALHRGYATAGAKARLVVFDLESFKVLKEVETGQGPDGILYVAAQKEVWTFNGRGKSITCVDASTLEVKATISLGGKPEAAAEDPEKGMVYVNLEDQSAIAAVDAKGHTVTGTHPVAPGQEPTGLVFDAKNHLLLAGCGNKKMVAVDVGSWKVVGEAEIGDHCDGVAFDPETGNAFASCRDFTGGMHVKGPAAFETLEGLPTPGGKTCCLDPKTHELFVMSGPRRGEKGTIKVLVFSPKG